MPEFNRKYCELWDKKIRSTAIAFTMHVSLLVSISFPILRFFKEVNVHIIKAIT